MSQPEHSSMIFGLGVLGGTMGTVYAVAAAGGSNTVIMSATDAATLLSGFGGAVVGGGISWLLARQTAREASRKDELQRRDNDFAIASAASLKLLSITNSLYTLSNYFQRERATRPKVRPHEAIRPMAGIIDHAGPFLTSDFPALFKANRGDLANRALQLEPRFRAIMAALKTYNEEHLALQALLAPFRGVGADRNRPISLKGDEKTLGPIVLKMDNLDGVITTLIGFVQDDLAEAKSLCEEWDQVLLGELGKSFLQVKDDVNT